MVLIKQRKLRKLTVEEMGRRVYPYFIELTERFIRDELGARSTDKLFNQEEKTDVCCPLCGEGVLERKRVEPIYSSSRRRHHTGNFYQYQCTNCNAKSEGIYCWSYED